MTTKINLFYLIFNASSILISNKISTTEQQKQKQTNRKIIFILYTPNEVTRAESASLDTLTVICHYRPTGSKLHGKNNSKERKYPHGWAVFTEINKKTPEKIQGSTGFTALSRNISSISYKHKLSRSNYREFTIISTVIWPYSLYKGNRFLKKLWCNVGGRV